MKRSLFVFLLLTFLLTVSAEAQIRGYPYAPRLRSLRVGLEGGVGVLGGDLTKESQHYHFRPIGFLEVTYVFHKNMALGAYGGGGQMRSTQEAFESNADFFEGGLLYEFRAPILRGSLFPVLQLRGGIASINSTLRDGISFADPSPGIHFTFGVGAGMEVISWRRVGLRAMFGVTYSSTDEWDIIVRGSDNDGYSWALISMHYYLQFRR